MAAVIKPIRSSPLSLIARHGTKRRDSWDTRRWIETHAHKNYTVYNRVKIQNILLLLYRTSCDYLLYIIFKIDIKVFIIASSYW